MRVSRLFLLLLAVAITAGGCARGPVMRVAMPAPQGIDNVVYGAAPASYGVAAPTYATAVAPSYATPTYAAPAPTYAATAPTYATYAPAAAPAYTTMASPYGTIAAPAPATMVAGYPAGMMAYGGNMQWPYTLDSADRLRIVVFGQDGLTNSYVLDASGNIDMPLIGTVPARGLTTDQLSARIADMLRQGYVREPHVAVEIEAYRPFFILGEVAQPGQYPYVANMTVETAVAIAGGFGPRGDHHAVVVSRNYGGQTVRLRVPVTAQIRPGDTIQVQERWF